MPKTKPDGKPDPSTSSQHQPFTTADAQLAYQHFTPIVQQLPESEIKICTVSVDIVRHNIGIGVRAIEGQHEVLRRKLPECRLDEVLELPALALGLAFAVRKIVPAASEGEIQQRLSEVRPLRELALSQLEIFAGLDMIPSAPIRAIRSGKGPLDTAGDAIAIAAKFGEHAAIIAGKHPFTDAQIASLSAGGNWLLQQLKPEGAVSEVSTRDPASVLRDRFWTTITQRHEELRQAGAVLFGLRDLDARIPPLAARVLGGGGTKVDEGDPVPSGEGQAGGLGEPKEE